MFEEEGWNDSYVLMDFLIVHDDDDDGRKNKNKQKKNRKGY